MLQDLTSHIWNGDPACLLFVHRLGNFVYAGQNRPLAKFLVHNHHRSIIKFNQKNQFTK